MPQVFPCLQCGEVISKDENYVSVSATKLVHEKCWPVYKAKQEKIATAAADGLTTGRS